MTKTKVKIKELHEYKPTTITDRDILFASMAILVVVGLLMLIYIN